MSGAETSAGPPTCQLFKFTTLFHKHTDDYWVAMREVEQGLCQGNAGDAVQEVAGRRDRSQAQHMHNSLTWLAADHRSTIIQLYCQPAYWSASGWLLQWACAHGRRAVGSPQPLGQRTQLCFLFCLQLVFWPAALLAVCSPLLCFHLAVLTSSGKEGADIGVYGQAGVRGRRVGGATRAGRRWPQPGCP